VVAPPAPPAAQFLPISTPLLLDSRARERKRRILIGSIAFVALALIVVLSVLALSSSSSDSNSAAPGAAAGSATTSPVATTSAAVTAPTTAAPTTALVVSATTQPTTSATAATVVATPVGTDAVLGKPNAPPETPPGAPVVTAAIVTTPVVTVPPPLTQADATNFFQSYLGLTTTGQYTQAWAVLTPRYQVKYLGFQNFVNFWNTVNGAGIRDATSIASGPGTQTLHMHLWYGKRKNGAIVNEIDDVDFIRDATGQILISDYRYLGVG